MVYKECYTIKEYHVWTVTVITVKKFSKIIYHLMSSTSILSS